MRSHELIPLLPFLAEGLIGRENAPTRAELDAAADAPRTFLLRGAELAALKARLEAGDHVLAEGVSRLRELADVHLSGPAPTVTDKQSWPRSASANDYCSMAIYYWPDANKKNGLPYVRRDGAVNPESANTKRYDAKRLERFVDALFHLSLAYYFTGEEAYARRTAEMLRVWFVEAKTRQTPHFSFAQGIPGKVSGQDFGIIEARRYLYVLDAEALIGTHVAWRDEDRAAFRAWFAAFDEWLRTSDAGKKAAQRKNNIGLWTELQLAIYALFLDDAPRAQALIKDVVARRLPEMIAPDGSQPEEMQRERPYDYAAFNMLAMMALARAGDAAGLDIWWEQTADGRSFARALDWVARAAQAQMRGRENEYGDLDATRAELEAETRALQVQRKRAAEAETGYDDMRARAAAMVQQLSTAVRELEDMSVAQARTLRAPLHPASARDNGQAQAELTELRESGAVARAEISRLSEECANERERALEAVRMAAESQARLDFVRAELDGVRAELADQKSSSESGAAERAALQARLEELARAEVAERDLRAELSEANARAEAAAEKAAADLADALAIAQAAEQRANDVLAQAEAAALAVEQRAKDDLAEAQALAEAALAGVRAELAQQAEAADARVADMEQSFRAELAAAQARASEVEQDLRAELAQAQAHARALADEIAQGHAASRVAQAALTDYLDDIAHFKEAEEGRRGEMLVLREELRLANERAAQVQAALRAKESDYRDRKAELERVREERGQAKQRASVAEKELRVERIRAARELKEVLQRAEKAERVAKVLQESTLWRVTEPLRVLGRTIRGGQALAAPHVNGGGHVGGASVGPVLLRSDAIAPAQATVSVTKPLNGASAHAVQAPADSAPPPKVAEAPRAAIQSKPAPANIESAPEHVGPTTEDMQAEYVAKGLDKRPDTFVLFRVIGNDLYPRHKKGQSRENVQFILENEPPLRDCEKRWVLNRIVDPDEEAAVIALLEKHGQNYERVPFDWDAFAETEFDFDCLPRGDFFVSGEGETLGPEQRERASVQIRRLKNNYVMNNNGARNTALKAGRALAKWVLPWDGNCFVTTAAWEEIRSQVIERPMMKHFIVPMARITDNADLLRADFRPEPQEEPQIIFRCDTEENFDERHPYGRRPKVELFWRLGVTGGWDRWQFDFWDLPKAPLSKEAKQFSYAGWVARLYSGQKHLEASDKNSFVKRGLARVEAIVSTLDYLDAERVRRAYAPDALLIYSDAGIEALTRGARAPGDPWGRQSEQLRRDAEAALARGPYSVVDKTTLAPSGDRHDYWHPAPYWWPNPNTPDGLPYVKKDGQRVPGTELYEEGSEKYDRTSLQRVFDDTTALALAWRVHRKAEYAAHGANMVRRWFTDPATRMNPHLTYSQVRLGHLKNLGAHSGIIEMKDLYYFLDAVRLLEQAGAFSTQDAEALRGWLSEYDVWLRTSKQGGQECAAINNHGTWYDVQAAAIAAYLGDYARLAGIFRGARERVYTQFTPDGEQPDEMSRTLTAHYCCFNLQGWTTLADIAARCGDRLWRFETRDGRSIKRALDWLLPYMELTEWPHQQISPFDFERFLPLFYAYERQFGEFPLKQRFRVRERYEIKPSFYPHDGIRPYWAI